MKVFRTLVWGSCLSLLTLAACEGGGGGITAAQNRFGNVFRQAYANPTNGTPVTPINQNAIVFNGVTGPDPTASPISL